MFDFTHLPCTGSIVGINNNSDSSSSVVKIINYLSRFPTSILSLQISYLPQADYIAMSMVNHHCHHVTCLPSSSPREVNICGNRLDHVFFAIPIQKLRPTHLRFDSTNRRDASDGPFFGGGSLSQLFPGRVGETSSGIHDRHPFINTIQQVTCHGRSSDLVKSMLPLLSNLLYFNSTSSLMGNGSCSSRTLTEINAPALIFEPTHVLIDLPELRRLHVKCISNICTP